VWRRQPGVNIGQSAVKRHQRLFPGANRARWVAQPSGNDGSPTPMPPNHGQGHPIISRHPTPPFLHRLVDMGPRHDRPSAAAQRDGAGDREMTAAEPHHEVGATLDTRVEARRDVPTMAPDRGQHASGVPDLLWVYMRAVTDTCSIGTAPRASYAQADRSAQAPAPYWQPSCLSLERLAIVMQRYL